MYVVGVGLLHGQVRSHKDHHLASWCSGLPGGISVSVGAQSAGTTRSRGDGPGKFWSVLVNVDLTGVLGWPIFASVKLETTARHPSFFLRRCLHRHGRMWRPSDGLASLLGPRLFRRRNGVDLQRLQSLDAIPTQKAPPGRRNRRGALCTVVRSGQSRPSEMPQVVSVALRKRKRYAPWPRARGRLSFPDRQVACAPG